MPNTPLTRREFVCGGTAVGLSAAALSAIEAGQPQSQTQPGDQAKAKGPAMKIGFHTDAFNSAYWSFEKCLQWAQKNRVASIECGLIDGVSWIHGLGYQPHVALYEDPEGALWVATSGTGLCRLKNGRWTRFTVESGLCDDKAFQILGDDRGHLAAGRPGLVTGDMLKPGIGNQVVNDMFKGASAGTARAASRR